MVRQVRLGGSSDTGLSEVIRLVRDGHHPDEIVLRLRGRLTPGTIRVYLCEIRKAGLDGGEPLSGGMLRIAGLPERASTLLSVEADKRKIMRSVLASAILEKVLLDDLVDAVLDDTRGRR